MSRRYINQGCVTDKKFGLNVIIRHDYKKGRDPWIERYVKQSVDLAQKYFKPKGKVLDIGCAYGYAINEFNNRGYKAEGVDAYPVQGVFDVKIKKMDFYQLSEFYLTGFDGVFINHTLEHADSAIRLVENTWRILKEHGIVFVAVPHIDDEWAWDLRDSTTHYSGFNEKFLESLWKRYGFKTLFLKTVELSPKRKPARREIWYVGKKGDVIPNAKFLDKAKTVFDGIHK